MGRRALDDQLERERQRIMIRMEKELWQTGHPLVAGVDEAGRGPLAGPVVAAAFILPEDLFVPGLNDSKQVRPGLREEIYDLLKQSGAVYSVGIGTPAEIDELNILGATRLAMGRAVAGLARRPDHLLIDALTLPGIDIPQKGVIRGDALCLSIAAASIIAKVTRDRMMEQFDKEFPGYGFAQHKGYPTAGHYRALAELGPTPIHRRSFRLTAEPQLALALEEGETG